MLNRMNTLFPYTTLFRSDHVMAELGEDQELVRDARVVAVGRQTVGDHPRPRLLLDEGLDHAVLLRLFANPDVRHDRHRAAPLPSISARPPDGGSALLDEPAAPLKRPRTHPSNRRPDRPPRPGAGAPSTRKTLR